MDWKSLLYTHFRTRPQPLTVYESTMVPAATVWTAKRLWVDYFRSLSLQPGDRIAIAAAPSPGFLASLFAAMWEGLTIALIPPAPEHDPSDLDARLILRAVHFDPAGAPVTDVAPELLDVHHAPTPDVRLLLRTFGSTGQPKWVALSDTNILSVLSSHLPLLYPHATLGAPDDEAARNGPVVLSILPWFHSFGLVVDLFTALFSGATLIRDPSGGRDVQSILRAGELYGVTHVSMVPLHVRRIAAAPGGLRFLQRLQGGVVGGAPITSDLVDILRTTKLRVGYGQTEASPGISLGRPGTFACNGLGDPVGCDVRITLEGHLQFKGHNACLGTFQRGQLMPLPTDRWQDTGDLVRRDDDRLIFIGRATSDFKLANGRVIRAALIEDDLARTMPGLNDAALISTDGETIDLVLCPARADFFPRHDVIERCLGPLIGKLRSITTGHINELPRTTKGDLDRAALARHLGGLQRRKAG